MEEYFVNVPVTLDVAVMVSAGTAEEAERIAIARVKAMDMVELAQGIGTSMSVEVAGVPRAYKNIW